MQVPISTGSRLLWLDRKDGILGLSEPEGAIPIAAVPTDKPKHQRTEVPRPNQGFPQSFHSIFKSRRNFPTSWTAQNIKPVKFCLFGNLWDVSFDCVVNAFRIPG